VRFSLLSAMGAPLPEGNADLVVAANVLEHCVDAVGVFGTLLAAVRPGGLVYVEAPSEFTLFERSDPDVEGQAYSSFWDDPTHVRPWPPAALYRLGLSYGARPEACHYAFRAGLHSGIALIRRIDPGPPRYRYVSLVDCPRRRGPGTCRAELERRLKRPRGPIHLRAPSESGQIPSHRASHSG
jgi:SAM-dependent methyltransferase